MTGSEEELSQHYVSLYARCVREDTEIYRNYLMYVPNITMTSQREEKDESSKYSVIILGMDGMSQLNIIRYRGCHQVTQSIFHTEDTALHLESAEEVRRRPLRGPEQDRPQQQPQPGQSHDLRNGGRV